MTAESYESAIRAPWVLPQGRQPHQVAAFAKDSLLLSQSQPPPTPPSPSSPGSRISPAVLFIIVILAVVFFVSGLLHLLVRFLIKKHPFSASQNSESRGAAAASEFQGPDALQRQLQQLFHLHDSGLDQAFIDALPVFLYREIIGSKEPFDCAVCLCEFAPDDKLRLLPACGHAFHINCIDTWLLSNSTCPLCRGALFAPGSLAVDNPDAFDFEDPTEDDRNHQDVSERVFSVRLGKFKNICNADEDGDTNGIAAAASLRMEEGETSSNNLDARRCFSMGYYQYVVAESNLQVTLSSNRVRNGDLNGVKGRGTTNEHQPMSLEAMEGNRLGIASRGESFSVSKIWQWPNKKGKFPAAGSAAAATSSGNTSPAGDFSWIRRSVADYT